MPKIKKNVNDENICPKKMTVKKKTKPVFKFAMKRTLKDRQAECEFWKKNDELDKKMKVVDDLFQKEVNNTIKQNEDTYPPVLPTIGYVIFDPSKFNVSSEENPDITGSYLQRLLLMSIEKNELKAKTIFNNLVKSNWSPVFEVCLQHSLCLQ